MRILSSVWTWIAGSLLLVGAAVPIWRAFGDRAAQRAYVVHEGPVLRQPLVAGQPLAITAGARNTGQTLARDVKSTYALILTPDGPESKAITPRFGTNTPGTHSVSNIGAGQQVALHFDGMPISKWRREPNASLVVEASTTLLAQEIAAIYNGTNRLFALVKSEYKDGFDDTIRTTDTCLLFWEGEFIHCDQPNAVQ